MLKKETTGHYSPYILYQRRSLKTLLQPSIQKGGLDHKAGDSYTSKGLLLFATLIINNIFQSFFFWIGPHFSASRTSPLLQSVWKLLKMSHFNFWILAFSTNFCPIKTDLSGNTVWPQTSGFQKLAKLSNFGILN